MREFANACEKVENKFNHNRPVYTQYFKMQIKDQILVDTTSQEWDENIFVGFNHQQVGGAGNQFTLNISFKQNERNVYKILDVENKLIHSLEITPSDDTSTLKDKTSLFGGDVWFQYGYGDDPTLRSPIYTCMISDYTRDVSNGVMSYTIKGVCGLILAKEIKLSTKQEYFEDAEGNEITNPFKFIKRIFEVEFGDEQSTNYQLYAVKFLDNCFEEGEGTAPLYAGSDVFQFSQKNIFQVIDDILKGIVTQSEYDGFKVATAVSQDSINSNIVEDSTTTDGIDSNTNNSTSNDSNSNTNSDNNNSSDNNSNNQTSNILNDVLTIDDDDNKKDSDDDKKDDNENNDDKDSDSNDSNSDDKDNDTKEVENDEPAYMPPPTDKQIFGWTLSSATTSSTSILENDKNSEDDNNFTGGKLGTVYIYKIPSYGHDSYTSPLDKMNFTNDENTVDGTNNPTTVTPEQSNEQAQLEEKIGQSDYSNAEGLEEYTDQKADMDMDFNWFGFGQSGFNHLVQKWQPEYNGSVLIATAQSLLKNESCTYLSMDAEGNIVKITGMGGPRIGINPNENGDYNLIQNAIQEFSSWSAMAQYTHKAKLTLVGIPTEIPIMGRIRVTPRLYNQVDFSAGIYAIVGKQDIMNSSGFMTELSLIKIAAHYNKPIEVENGTVVSIASSTDSSTSSTDGIQDANPTKEEVEESLKDAQGDYDKLDDKYETALWEMDEDERNKLLKDNGFDPDKLPESSKPKDDDNKNEPIEDPNPTENSQEKAIKGRDR